MLWLFVSITLRLSHDRVWALGVKKMKPRPSLRIVCRFYLKQEDHFTENLNTTSAYGGVGAGDSHSLFWFSHSVIPTVNDVC